MLKKIWYQGLRIFLGLLLLSVVVSMVISKTPPDVFAFLSCVNHAEKIRILDQRDSKIYIVCDQCYRLVETTVPEKLPTTDLVHYVIYSKMTIKLIVPINTVPYIHPDIVELIERDKLERLQPTIIYNDIKEG